MRLEYCTVNSGFTKPFIQACNPALEHLSTLSELNEFFPGLQMQSYSTLYFSKENNL